MPDKPKIFITHSWKDIDFARRLYNDLKAQGFEVWFDDKNMQAGHRMAQEINRGLAWCDVYMPVISRASLDSKWCDEEINAGISLSVEGNQKPKIISVLVEDCREDLKKRYPSLSARLYINFTGRYEDSLRDLLQKGFEVGFNQQAAREKSKHRRPATHYKSKQLSSGTRKGASQPTTPQRVKQKGIPKQKPEPKTGRNGRGNEGKQTRARERVENKPNNTTATSPEKLFLMPIEDVFAIAGRGTVVVGRVERGQIRVGDAVEIVGKSKTLRSVVVVIQMFNKLIDLGQVGDNIGCLLRGIERDDIERGMILVAPAMTKSKTDF